MARRTPKPFTVEIRSSGRRPKLSPAGLTLPPGEHEQPHVAAWPGFDEAPAEERPSEPPAPTAALPPPLARILPSLELPPVRLPRAEDHAGERAESEREPVETMAGAASPRPLPPTPDEDDLEDASDVWPEPAAATMRRRRARLPRDAFRREERWRARLPMVVHRTRRRGD